ncbi:MAG TPA: STAS domain-containing protein [Actinomycetes bacterium]|nr:STAS domain-containing protein [Actinomycetes bacterium]
MSEIASATSVVRHVRVTARGRVDAVVAPQLREQLDLALSEGCAELLVDLAEVTFLDSAGLAALVRARKDSIAAGCTLRLVAPRSDEAMRVFRLTTFDEVFDFVAPTGPAGPAQG